jgi:hypothetical protein
LQKKRKKSTLKFRLLYDCKFLLNEGSPAAMKKLKNGKMSKFLNYAYWRETLRSLVSGKLFAPNEPKPLCARKESVHRVS